MKMHALGNPSSLPPLAPSPTQSLERVQAFVHHKPLQVSPGLHAAPKRPHGSPTPSWPQTGHFD
jgi:hypothetical protein